MANDYQVRKDIDNIIQETQELSDNQELMVKFDSESKYYTENATIDTVLDNFYDIPQINELISTISGEGAVTVGGFSINNNGHLVVDLPSGVSNPFTISNTGHLIYDTNASGD